MSGKTRILIICGATAAGKSAAAVDVAVRLNGEIVGADSMQIYRGMDIGTAKIPESEMRGIKHHMIDVADPKDSYSVSDYVTGALKAIESIADRGRLPIIVGGTGLYIDGLLYEQAYGRCSADENLRASLNARYDVDGGEELYREMLRLDSEDTAKYHKNNRHRLLRAWEIYLLSGRTKSEHSAERSERYRADMLVVEAPRDKLYRRIEERVDKMFAAGIEQEVKVLLRSGVTFADQSMQAIGYKEFEPYFDGAASIDEVKAAIKINTRHYAKRQITWFNRYRNAIRIEPSAALEAALKIYG